MHFANSFNRHHRHRDFGGVDYVPIDNEKKGRAQSAELKFELKTSIKNRRDFAPIFFSNQNNSCEVFILRRLQRVALLLLLFVQPTF